MLAVVTRPPLLTQRPQSGSGTLCVVATHDDLTPGLAKASRCCKRHVPFDESVQNPAGKSEEGGERQSATRPGTPPVVRAGDSPVGRMEWRRSDADTKRAFGDGLGSGGLPRGD